jgi:hypothetical protein
MKQMRKFHITSSWKIPANPREVEYIAQAINLLPLLKKIRSAKTRQTIKGEPFHVVPIVNLLLPATRFHTIQLILKVRLLALAIVI